MARTLSLLTSHDRNKQIAKSCLPYTLRVNFEPYTTQECGMMVVNENDKEDVGWLWWGNQANTIILLVLVFLWILKKLIFATQHRWFAYVMHLCTKDEFEPLEEVKRDHFASMSSIISQDPELRKKNAIKILEIGVGTGVNLAHYPKGSHLVVVDPNPNFKSYYDSNKEKFSNILTEEFFVTTGDDMGMIDEGSVDVVVVTLVLCSVNNIGKVLREILRVLAPGGKFYFMEHIVEFDVKKHWWRRQMQDIFTHWLPVWPIVFDGCQLNRDMLPDIQKAGFSKVEAEKYYAPVPHWVFDPERPNLKGVATK
ncbi:hypothetical protein Pmani_024090 [Petrolisthes manimaculis]|uniref:Methyltransferase type 11 domain-containing protein n=1 Tax=Petrolisthes manimaculis TaxID=1843537 RepID=A0AAE1U0E0_9EUCA|nr:hypothetical protein Pmani_024090 [Petrolisthes manimaculis]